MANRWYPRGLVNPQLITGGEPNTEPATVLGTYTTPFFKGDLVARRAAGVVVHAGTYQVGAGAVTFLGVCDSYLPGSTGGEIQVITDLVNTRWEVQITAAHAAWVGQTTIIGLGVSFGNNTGKPGADIGRQAVYQSSCFATTAIAGSPTGIAEITDVVRRGDNDLTSATSNSPWVIVRFRAEHFHA